MALPFKIVETDLSANITVRGSTCFWFAGQTFLLLAFFFFLSQKEIPRLLASMWVNDHPKQNTQSQVISIEKVSLSSRSRFTLHFIQFRHFWLVKSKPFFCVRCSRLDFEKTFFHSPPAWSRRFLFGVLLCWQKKDSPSLVSCLIEWGDCEKASWNQICRWYLRRET